MTDLIERAERFARVCHAGQCRKGAAKEPYTIHLQEVSSLVEKWGGSKEAIAAAWLHDTVEDCPPTSHEDLVAEFGDRVANFVAELTDDKSLPKPKRKELQIENASKKTPEAALVKLADKTSNVGAIAKSPPEGWSLARRLQYIAWAETVVSALPHLPEKELNEFKRRCEQAELQAYIDQGTQRQAQNAALRIMEQKVLRAGKSQERADQFLLNLMSDTLKPS
ncbi:HD domain-containing protein [Paracoccaceae bacterium]|nr:HD domain-containing protein [Paracoccaceae bacterium]